MHENHMHTTLRAPKQTNHVLHLLLTMGTCGAWGFVWAGVALYNAMTKDITQVRSSWVGTVPQPYAVGPGAPVGPMNPHPPVPAVGMRPMPPYVGYAPGRGPVNMASPPVVPGPTGPVEWQEPVRCGIGDCDYQTVYGPRLQMHQALPHPLPRAQ